MFTVQFVCLKKFKYFGFSLIKNYKRKVIIYSDPWYMVISKIWKIIIFFQRESFYDYTWGYVQTPRTSPFHGSYSHLVPLIPYLTIAKTILVRNLFFAFLRLWTVWHKTTIKTETRLFKKPYDLFSQFPATGSVFCYFVLFFSFLPMCQIQMTPFNRNNE